MPWQVLRMGAAMKCPKCQAEMECVNTPYADAARCTACKGLWLDMLEHEDLKEIAEAVDIGDASEGRKYNELTEVYCPMCPNSRLLRMVDPVQPHIWFESCPTCYGRYYDAGEYRDWSQHTIMDFFRDLFARERK